MLPPEKEKKKKKKLQAAHTSQPSTLSPTPDPGKLGPTRRREAMAVPQVTPKVVGWFADSKV